MILTALKIPKPKVWLRFFPIGDDLLLILFPGTSGSSERSKKNLGKFKTIISDLTIDLILAASVELLRRASMPFKATEDKAEAQLEAKQVRPAKQKGEQNR